MAAASKKQGAWEIRPASAAPLTRLLQRPPQSATPGPTQERNHLAVYPHVMSGMCDPPPYSGRCASPVIVRFVSTTGASVPGCPPPTESL